MGFGKRFTEGFIIPGHLNTPGAHVLPSTLETSQLRIANRNAFLCDKQVIEGDMRPDRNNPGPGSYFDN